MKSPRIRTWVEVIDFDNQKEILLWEILLELN
jgi:hypothetical protein